MQGVAPQHTCTMHVNTCGDFSQYCMPTNTQHRACVCDGSGGGRKEGGGGGGEGGGGRAPT